MDLNSAKNHYKNNGYSEGRSLTSFSASSYLSKYSDLAAAFGDNETLALRHYIESGYAEGRSDSLSNSNSTDSDSSTGLTTQETTSSISEIEALNYIASYSDLVKNFGIDTISASNHYINNGLNEGRSKDLFDEWGYLASNSDLITVFGKNITEAIKHFILFGSSEGRKTNLFDAESYLNNNQDLKDAFGDNLELAKKHFVENGFAEGRVF